MGKPSPSSFYYRAFRANLRTANEVAATPYLQSMHTGTLSPLDYGCLTVQDAYYCYQAQETLRLTLARIDRAAQPELFEIVESKVRGYEGYNQTFLEDWHIRNAQSVLPTEAMGPTSSTSGAWLAKKIPSTPWWPLCPAITYGRGSRDSS